MDTLPWVGEIGDGQTMNISNLAVVESEDLGADVQIHPFAVVRSGVRIGRGAIIHPHATIESGTRIGDGVEVFPGAHIGKAPRGAGATARTPSFRPFVTIGDSAVIGPNAVIYYDVEIGANTLIGDGASIREGCRIGSSCIISRCVTLNYNAVIGDRTKIMDLTHITGNMTVGSDVFISVHVSTTNDNKLGRSGYSDDAIRGPIIADRVAIGAGAVLLPGITIGSDATVAAGSVVTKSVEPATLVMGVPARPSRKPAG